MEYLLMVTSIVSCAVSIATLIVVLKYQRGAQDGKDI